MKMESVKCWDEKQEVRARFIVNVPSLHCLRVHVALQYDFDEVS